jgi:RimJ/RimL family protein N-acetyltransferase
MNTSVFDGKLVHLTIVDPEKDAEMLTKWDHDSEYDRLLNAGAAYMWPPKMMKEWIEKEKDIYFFIIRTLADDQPIGLVDLSGFNWSARSAWVGIGLGERDFWGKGYGTDAMQVILRYAFEELNLNRVNLDVFEYNERAKKSYLKCGFVEEGRTRKAMTRDGKRWDIIYMGILRSEWEERNKR